MSWEKDFTHRYPCPCGKGEYEVSWYSNDWGRSSNEYVMLCPECKEQYAYCRQVVYGHPGNEVERGWVYKSVLIAEENKRTEIFNKVKEQCFNIWVSKFNALNTKKSMWILLTANGKYNPALGTFYSNTNGYSKEDLINKINGYFILQNIKRIYEVCDIKLDYNYFGVDEHELSNVIRFS